MEKVIFFECRLEQLEAELARANEEIQRLRSDLAQATRREVALKQELAAAETRAAQAERERDDARARAEALRAEHERFLDKLIEAERVRQAGEAEPDEIDLAGFMAELRAEVLELRASAAASARAAPEAPAAEKPNAPRADALRSSPFASAEHAGEVLAAGGRIGLTEEDRKALCAAASFQTRGEETLFALSLRELASDDEPARQRAAQRLKGLGARAALPALAAALNRESSPAVCCALLEAMAAAGEPSVLPLVAPLLKSESVEVRLAALETAFRLGQVEVLEGALDDASALVRRRAAVLASGSEQGHAVLWRAIKDGDASVRRVAALGLRATRPESREALFAALDDPEVSVRRAAAKSLSHELGPEVFAVADLDSARRRREIRKLSTAPARGCSTEAEAPRPIAAEQSAPAPAQPAAATPASDAGPAPKASSFASAVLGRLSSLEREVCVEHQAPPEPRPSIAAPALESEILSQVLATLRGLSADELARGVGGDPARVHHTVAALERTGRLVKRGQRYFAP